MNGREPGLPKQEQLIGDLRQVIENAEELLKNTGEYTGTSHAGARAKLAQALESANQELVGFENSQILRMMEATAAANLRHNDRTGEAKLMRAFDQL